MSYDPAVTAYIALGANLGNPMETLMNTSKQLDAREGIQCIAMSPIYTSIPHGDVEQPDYHNAVLAIRTTKTAQDLLSITQEIESAHGRERTIHWGPRTLDLDIILYGQETLTSDTLTIPHPRAHEREFVIQPLYDLDPTLNIPHIGRVSAIRTTLPLHNLTEVYHGTTYHH